MTLYNGHNATVEMTTLIDPLIFPATAVGGDRQYVTSNRRTLGSRTAKNLQGGYTHNLTVEFAEGAAASSAYATVMEAFLTASKKQLAVYRPSHSTGAAYYQSDYYCTEISNFMQIDRESSDDKKISTTWVGAGALTSGTAAADTTGTETYAPIVMHQGIFKYTSGGLVTAASIKTLSNATLRQTATPYHVGTTSAGAPSAVVPGVYEGSFDLTVYAEEGASTDYAKLLALVNAAAFACEYGSPDLATGSNKLSFNARITGVKHIEGAYNTDTPQVAVFNFVIDGAVTHTIVA